MLRIRHKVGISCMRTYILTLRARQILCICVMADDGGRNSTEFGARNFVEGRCLNILFLHQDTLRLTLMSLVAHDCRSLSRFRSPAP